MAIGQKLPPLSCHMNLYLADCNMKIGFNRGNKRERKDEQEKSHSPLIPNLCCCSVLSDSMRPQGLE